MAVVLCVWMQMRKRGLYYVQTNNVNVFLKFDYIAKKTGEEILQSKELRSLPAPV